VDINLGDESGFDLAEQLARGSGSPPVVLTSTESEEELGDMIAVSPAIGFVPKAGLSPDALRRLLGGASARQDG
jgi:hypothetical protein